MTRRRLRNTDESDISLDSFMDIVTNVIGALFFVIIFVALASYGARGRLVTPMLSQADTSGVFFECRDNRAYFPDIEGLIDTMVEVWGTGDVNTTAEFDRRVARLRQANIQNDFYRFEPDVQDLVIIKRLSQKFVPIGQGKGENMIELEKEDSVLARAMDKLDPSKQHVFFIVDSNSFEVFHAARRLAMEKGLSVGWNPISADDPLRFGSGGVVSQNQVY